LITLNGGLVLLLLIRIVIHVFIMKPLISSKALATPLMIIGRDKKDLELHADWLMNNRHLGFKIASQMVCTKIDFIWVEDFDRQIRDTGAPEVLLLPGMESDKNFSKFINYLADLDIHVNWIPLDSGNLGYWQIPSAQEGIPFLTFEVSRISFAQRFVKRLFDIIFSTIVLVCISPFLALISIVIMVTDGRPVFYSQTRIGKNGKSFKFIKFRSMIRGAEEIVDTVENVHGSGHVLFKNRRDPRVTPIGRILRKYSLDELPQFWNVLKNNMSVVGPRPALPREVNIYSSIYERRLMAKPGITGPWQISGRSDLDLQTSIALDLNYMTNWSFFHDLWIIISTVKVMVNGRGAY
jgi:exopolysaccharide biosynthesis polyprenyl glycosylphosphotransferase